MFLNRSALYPQISHNSSTSTFLLPSSPSGAQDALHRPEVHGYNKGKFFMPSHPSKPKDGIDEREHDKDDGKRFSPYQILPIAQTSIQYTPLNNNASSSVTAQSRQTRSNNPILERQHKFLARPKKHPTEKERYFNQRALYAASGSSYSGWVNILA